VSQLLKVSWVGIIVTAFLIASMAWPSSALPAAAAQSKRTKTNRGLQELPDKNPE
jgi:hypothetical protein